MNFNELLNNLNIESNEDINNKFDIYFKFLTEYNEKVNLTAITDYEGVYLKHFYDSLTLSTSIDLTKNLTLCDVGAGAGFPSVPNAICFPNIDVTIIDSLNKRIIFLNELINKLGINNVNAIHSRAEEYALDKRESFDVVTARAVARLNILSELCLPLVKVGGYFIAMKASDADQELEEAEQAIKTLGGVVDRVITFVLPDNQGTRNIIVVKKISKTPKQYPRAFAQIKKAPIM